MNLKLIDKQSEDERGEPDKRPRLLIFIVAYFADATIGSVLHRIPRELADEYETEILVIDDASDDQTFKRATEIKEAGDASLRTQRPSESIRAVSWIL